MQHPARLVFLHQNCLFRQLLVQAFSNLEGFEAAELNHARPDRCDHLQAIEPAVVLLDLSLPHKLAVELTSFARASAKVKSDRAGPGSQADRAHGGCAAGLY